MKEFDTRSTLEIVCPYCGYEFIDSWEVPDGEDVLECDDCEKEFVLDMECVRYFTTWEMPSDKDNYKLMRLQEKDILKEEDYKVILLAEDAGIKVVSNNIYSKMGIKLSLRRKYPYGLWIDNERIIEELNKIIDRKKII